ncbi:hypothetical protein JCM10914A_08940 [Paenibacillus sp. JCM 10914]|uniref:copper amine oxidase N-terminal domain-containing protein n=1 Tax=Paenibacillus sp. JCM 10914 TaxID=1236974 RepID=UPI0003CC3B04|nr:copper amine oxidase N-terminal domain-containing protein [Paenibacillus sp. JCM 10914]GAE09725.1 hypothetical protein JCM10914_6103 [Paenibacillus sp. JCM 10914]
MKVRNEVRLLIFLLFLFMFPTVSHGQGSNVIATIEYGEYKSPFPLETPLIMKNGRMLLPLRETAHLLGLKLYWNPQTQTASLYGVNTEMSLKVGASHACVNRKQIELNTPAQLVKGVTYVPIQFVASAMNEKVLWNPRTRMLSIGSTYAMGSDKGITFWLDRKSGEFYQAIGNRIPQFIGSLDIRVEELIKLEVERLSDTTSYIRLHEAVGPAASVKQSGQIFVKDGQIHREMNFGFVGSYPDSNTYKLYDLFDNRLLSDGKQAEFLDFDGTVVASYNLQEIVGKDDIYMIEYATFYYLILREYSTQHLVIYHRMREITKYVHERLPLPPEEIKFLEESALDRANVIHDTRLIFLQQEDGALFFGYENKPTDEHDLYAFNLKDL